MKNNERVKKAVAAFVISLLIFSLAAFLLSMAFSSGRKNRNADTGKENIDPNGSTVNILLVLSDYAPDKFNDYDPESVKNVMGMSIPAPSESPDSILSGYRKVFAERMVIVRVDTIRGIMAFVPIAGDTLVNFKGLQLKLGEIAGEWGISMLVEKVHAITGLEIDNFAVFSPQNTAKALDLIGSVDYTVKCNMKLTIANKGIDINIAAGTSRLDGKTTVDLLRFDRYEGTGSSRGDIVSGYVKRAVSSLQEKFTEKELNEKINSALDLSYTNLDIENDKDRIALISSLSKLKVEYTELEGGWQTVDNARYFVLNETETLKKLTAYRDK